MQGLILRNIHTLVTMDDNFTVLHNVDLKIEENRIVDIRQGIEDAHAEELDCSSCVVYPGFINTHHHLYQTLQRCVPKVQSKKLFDWLVTLYEIWRELTPEAVYVSAMVGMAELLLSGCTTTSDHFYVFPKGRSERLVDSSIEAAQRIGIRFHVSRGSMSRGKSKGGLPPDDVVQDEDTILKDTQRLIEEYHDPKDFSMLRVVVAPCSPFSVTEDLMREAAKLARSYEKVYLHTHLAETLDEEKYCVEMHGVRPLAYAEKVGWLGEDVWFAHGIHFNDEELSVLANTKTGVAHCPSSNQRLGSGIARIPEMLKLGIRVGLAVDGSASNDASNMVLEMRHALLLHRTLSGADAITPMQVLYLATRGGAQLLGRPELGQIAAGKAADLAVFTLNDIGLAGALHDPAAAIFLSFSTGRTKYTIVNGKVVVRNGTVVGLDIDELIQMANNVASDMIQKATAKTGIDFLGSE